MLKRILAAVALSFALLGAVAAAELTAEQRSALEARIASFDEAMRTSDMDGVLSVVPDKIMAKIAENAGVTTEEVIKAAQEQMDELLKTVKIEDFGMDLDAARIEAHEDGTPYALIPSFTVIDMGESGKIRSSNETLALLDAGEWYLLRTDDAQQVAILKEVYPEFADIEFKAGTMEQVTQ